jgi:hypothetical protein
VRTGPPREIVVFPLLRAKTNVTDTQSFGRVSRLPGLAVT